MFASIYIFFLFAVVLVSGEESSSNRPHFKCENGTVHNRVRLFIYSCPWSTSKDKHLDDRGEIVYPLQEYLNNGGKYVTVYGNLDSGIPYGTKVCIEELNEHFRRRIPLEIRGRFFYYEGETFFTVHDYSALYICDTHLGSLDRFFNPYFTIHVY